MNATEALEQMKRGEYVQPKHGGAFWLSLGRVNFSCGDENCCQWDMSIQEFLEQNKNERFKVG